MSALKFACISPHPPIIVHEVGRGRQRETQRTIAALEEVARQMALHAPETALLMATHGPLNYGAFTILAGPLAEGDFSQWGAPQVRFRFENDLDAVALIRDEAQKASLPLAAIDHWDSGLDWSCTVPLYYLRPGLGDAKLVPLCISFLSARQHFAFGQAVRRAMERLGKRVAIIASADLSHRLSDDGPYGYDPAGPEFDRRIQEAVANWDVESVLSMDMAFREKAGDDAVSSLSFLMGALDGLPVRPRVLSYEGPFGVGYLVAAIDILDEEGTPEKIADGLVEAPPVQPARAEPSHPLVRLAKEAVEAWVRHRRVIEPSEMPPEGQRPAAAFVSIKTRDGALRGCIGTIEPTQPTLAQEVVRNAIDSAIYDPRFLPVTPEELDSLTYSVDVLSPPERIEGPHMLDPKRYGVIVQSGPRRGLLLPDLEGVDTVEEQVAIARAKGGILPEEPAELWRFEVRRLG